nr:TolC family protein [Kofleriaceae bacterium]
MTTAVAAVTTAAAAATTEEATRPMRLARHILAAACACALVVPATATADARAPGDHGAADGDGDGDAVTLADLLAAAVRRSPGLAMARADRSDGRDRVTAAGAIDEWHLFGRATGQDTAYPRELAAPGMALATRSVGGEVGVSRNLATGGDVSVAVATSEVDYIYPTVTATAEVAQTGSYHVGGTVTSLRLVASQPLVRGAGDDAARADQKIQQLTGHALAAAADDEAAQQIRQIVFAYWELAFATSALAVDREGEQLALRQVAITREVVRAGMQPPTANEQADMQVALRREAMLRDETTIDDESLQLRRLTGLELADAPLVPADAIEVPDDERGEAEVVAAARERGPGLAQKQLAAKTADVQVAALDNATRPRVDLSLTGELSGVGADIGDAAGRIGDGEMFSLMGGITVQWDVGGAERAAAAGARVRRVRDDAEMADLDAQLAAAAMSSVHQLTRARERIALAQTAVTAAVDSLRAEVAAFQSGRSTNVAVFQRQDELSVAKLRLARARIDAIESEAQVDYVSGELLARHHVTVTGRRGS